MKRELCRLLVVLALLVSTNANAFAWVIVNGEHEIDSIPQVYCQSAASENSENESENNNEDEEEPDCD